jgi:hypothetical protein
VIGPGHGRRAHFAVRGGQGGFDAYPLTRADQIALRAEVNK